MLGLGAVALFALGFGLGWLVRGEHAAPVDLADASSVASTTSGAAAFEGGLPDGGRRDGAVETVASRTDRSGAGTSGASGEGSVAVVGADRAAASTGSDGTSAHEGASGDDPPRGASADAGVRGRLDANAIRDVVRSHRDELGFCFAWQLHQHPDLGGRLVMELEIGADGHVVRARVADDALGDETVARCFVGVTRRMEFPPPESGTVMVRYPFDLSPGEPEQDD